jgi:hypothetical protein
MLILLRSNSKLWLIQTLCVAEVFQIVSDFEIQLIKMSFDSVFEFVMNNRSQSIIFIIVVISLNEQIINEFVDKNIIRSSRFSSFSKRIFVSTLIRLWFSTKWKISRKLFVDDDSTMIILINKLKICCMRFNKIKNDDFDLKNSTDQCEFNSTRDTQCRHCELRWCLS